MYILNILQQLQYRAHLYLALKNKTLITILLQFIFLLLISLVYNFDYASCMTGENETDRLSDIPPLDKDFIEHTVEGILYHETSEYSRFFQNNFTPEEWNSLRHEEKILGPAFQCMERTCQARFLENDLESFADKSFEEKLDILQNAYLHESAERRTYELECERYYDKAIKRQELLIESKETIRSLTQENLELKRQLNEQYRFLRETEKK